jgi:hypothetical protein
MEVHPNAFPSAMMGSPDIASKVYYVEHLGESPTIMEGESVTEASVQQREADEQHLILGRRLPEQYGTAYPNKRRLVITTMSSEPVCLERYSVDYCSLNHLLHMYFSPSLRCHYKT